MGNVAAFAEANRVLPLVHVRTRLPVDGVLAGPGLEDLFFARAEQRPIGDVTVPVASAEDVVSMKVPGGAPRISPTPRQSSALSAPRRICIGCARHFGRSSRH